MLLGRRDRQTMRVRVRGPHPLRPGIQPGSPGTWFYATDGRPVGAGKRDPSTPRAQPPTGITRARFGLIRFRSPLLTEYPFLQVLRCFTSLRTPRTRRYRPMTAGGFPHSEILGSKPCWRLPEAYRSLKRPSSVLSAFDSKSTARTRNQRKPRLARVHYPVLKPPRTTTPSGRDQPAIRHDGHRIAPGRSLGWRSGSPKAHPHHSRGTSHDGRTESP